MNWDEAVAYALALPDTALSTSYGKPAVKAFGRTILAPGHEPHDSFMLSLPLDAVDMLTGMEPETFYQTPHYVGWGAVLGRYSGDAERVGYWIGQAWEYAEGKKGRRQAVKA